MDSIDITFFVSQFGLTCALIIIDVQQYLAGLTIIYNLLIVGFGLRDKTNFARKNT